jgi:hypothetical protein
MTAKVFLTNGKIEEYPNANITWEWDDESGELGPNSGWRIHSNDGNCFVNAFIYPSECKKIEITHEKSDMVFKRPKAKPIPKGILRIWNERIRQIQKEKWTAEHDDLHSRGQLAVAAVCYALPKDYRKDTELPEHYWPWDWKWWKPSPKDRIKELVKAGALIAAEIDRLIRLEKNGD